MNLHDLGEFGFINRCREHLAQRGGVRVGIGDDAAVLDGITSPVVTCDCLVERVHFRRDWTTPRQLGRKAVAVNVSDIAAMGGQPIAAFISLALGPHDDLTFVDELYRGLDEAAFNYDLTIAGGDTARSLSDLMINITVIGNAPAPILRGGAREGDAVLVTGTLGDAAAGLAVLQNPDLEIAAAPRADLLQRHHDPTARLREMQAALAAVSRSSNIHAAIDISDGLLGDAGHVAQASGVSIELEMERLPVTKICRDAARALRCKESEWVLRGGEDYELLLCVAPLEAAAVIAAVTAATGTPVTEIGRCVPRASEAVTLIQTDGRRIIAPAIGFTHF